MGLACDGPGRYFLQSRGLLEASDRLRNLREQLNSVMVPCSRDPLLQVAISVHLNHIFIISTSTGSDIMSVAPIVAGVDLAIQALHEITMEI